MQRFRTDGFTVLPAPGKLGELWDQRRPARDEGGDRVRLRARRGVARVRHRHELHAGARSELRTVEGDRRSRVPQRSARRGDAREEPESRPRARGHGELRQALSGARLRVGGFARRAADRRSPARRDPRRRCHAVRLARHGARVGDPGARDLSRRSTRSRRGSRACGCRTSCASGSASTGAIFSDDLSMEAARAGGTLTRSGDGRAHGGLRHGARSAISRRKRKRCSTQLRFTPSKASVQRSKRCARAGRRRAGASCNRRSQYQQARALLTKRLGLNF